MRPSSPLKNWMMILAVGCLLTLCSGSSVDADGCWGSSRGGWGSGGSMGGGSWGSRGGLFSNQPVRNLLARVGNRVGNGLANLGDGVADVLDRRPLRNALFGCNGSNGSWGSRGGLGCNGGWGSNGGWSCNGGSWGGHACNGSYASPVSSYPSYVSIPSSVVAMEPIATSVPFMQTTDCFACAGGVSAYVNPMTGYQPGVGMPVNQIETSGQVLDYGYYGNQMGSIGAPTDSVIVDGALITGPMMGPQEGSNSSTGNSPDNLELPPYYNENENEEDADVPPFGAQEEDDDAAYMPRGRAILSLDVPRDAKVYINDKLTHTEGTRRSYVSRNLAFGQKYRYRVKVVSDVEGKEVVKHRDITMRGGEMNQIAFNFDPIVTRVVLNVPDDAKVTIDGKETSASGSYRTFSTKKLKTGKWEDYSVEVSVVRDGKTITKRESFDLGAGEFRFFEFEFDKASASSIASK